MNRRCSVLCLIVLVAMTGLFAASAAVTNIVKMQVQSPTSWTFNPSNSAINVGDTITWTNTHASQTHDSTAGRPDSGFSNGWESPLLNTSLGQTFSFTFSNAGVFPYRCAKHADTNAISQGTYHPEQTGMVSVASANLPPSVTLTNPANNSTFTAPATFTLMANATDDGSVTNVQFFSGVTSLSNVTGAPFNLLIASLAAGNYAFSAVATDNTGLLGTSPVVNVSVFTNALLTSFAAPSNGQSHFSIVAIAGQTYFIDASADLTNWTPIATNFALSNLLNVVDPGASNFPFRFYRSRQ